MSNSRRNSGIEADVNAKADLDKFPEIVSEQLFNEMNHFTIGDLHANPMKLIYFLITCRIIEVSPAQYDILKAECAKLENDYLTDAEHHAAFAQFVATLSSCKILNTNKLVRLLGDNLADRGPNDALIIFMLAFLSKANIEIELSNHDLEFILHYEQGFKHYNPSINPAAAVSLSRFMRFIQGNDQLQKFFNVLIQKHYLPRLKLLSYSIPVVTKDEKPILNSYPHAPVCIKTVAALADKLNVDLTGLNIYDEPKDMANAIHLINQAFQTVLKEKKLHTLVDIERSGAGRGNSHVSLEFPIERVTWNRVITDADIAENNKAKYKWVVHHGHTGAVGQPNYISYDNTFGKSAYHTIGILDLHLSANKIDPDIEMLFQKTMTARMATQEIKFVEKSTGNEVKSNNIAPISPTSSQVLHDPKPGFMDQLKAQLKNNYIRGLSIATLGIFLLFFVAGFSMYYGYKACISNDTKPAGGAAPSSTLRLTKNGIAGGPEAYAQNQQKLGSSVVQFNRIYNLDSENQPLSLVPSPQKRR